MPTKTRAYLASERSPRLAYEALRELSRTQGRMLDTRRHCFLAVANGRQLGCFSTLAMAFGEVDERMKAYRGTDWQETAVAHIDNYVIDLVGDRIYERVAAHVPVTSPAVAFESPPAACPGAGL